MSNAIKDLCKLLEAREVEFKTHDTVIGKAVTWSGSTCNWVALLDEMGLAVAVYKDYLTPEQAIAATLGEEIVRCGKCRHAVEPPICITWANHLDPDGFCAWSEGKVNTNDSSN